MSEEIVPSVFGGRSAAAGSNSGVVATGDHNQIEYRTVVLPAAVWEPLPCRMTRWRG
ncbi:hypothetical protein SAZ11_19385 [Streptomyces sp. FXJ1.4098]|nr:hypothetical protein [Streptomyces sp. FXJ1.4098]